MLERKRLPHFMISTFVATPAPCMLAVVMLAAIALPGRQARAQLGMPAYERPVLFPGVTLDGPRELDPQAPTVIDEARFVPPKLRKRLMWHFTDLPLGEFAAEFSRRVGLPVMIAEANLKDVGIPLSEPVTGSIEDLPAYLLLERVLHDRLLLDWLVIDGIMHITKFEYADADMETHVYLIGELLDSGCTAESLIDTLQTVTSGSWLNVDGAGGSISVAGLTLVIRQEQSVHREIAGTLDALRHPARRTIVGDSSRREQIETQLDQPVESVAFAETPLDKALEQLAEQTGLPIHLRSNSLTDIGLEQDTPVTLDINGATPRTILRLILKDLGLTNVNQHGQLLITSSAEAEDRFLIAVYDVSDLCRTGEQTQTLIDVLQSGIDGRWNDIDGIGGDVIVPRVGTLAIRQTYQAQRDIPALLEQLRTALDGELLLDPARLNDTQIDTRYYHLPRQQALDLLGILPKQIGSGTWNTISTAGGDGVRQLQVPGTVGTLQFTSGRHGKSATPGVVAAPQAILMITHQRGVLRQIERFLKQLEHDSREKKTRPSRYGASGGFGSIPAASTTPALAD